MMTSLRVVILLRLLLEHDPRFRGGGPFPKTSTHPGSSPEQAFSGSCCKLAANRDAVDEQAALADHFLAGAQAVDHLQQPTIPRTRHDLPQLDALVITSD